MKTICSLGTSPLMIYHLLPCFKDFGFNINNFQHRSWMTMSTKEGLYWLEHDLKESNCDLLIFGGNFPPYFLNIPDLCKRYNCKFLYWAIEDPVCFNETLSLAKQADFIFTTTIECIEKYKNNGVDSELLLFACNPNYHKIGKVKEQFLYDCVLQASYNLWKARLQGYDIILKPILDTIDNIAIWGACWDTQGKTYLGSKYNKFRGYFPNNYLGDLCESAKIILGVQCDDSSISQISMRPFEILACGGFHLTQYTKATVNLFEDGKHLITSKSREETLDIVKYYLKNEDERDKIRFQGMEFVRKNHTYYNRIKDVILPHINKNGGF